MVNNDYLCSEYYVLYMDTVKIKGYKSLRDITLKIGNVYERRLAAYVTMSGGCG